MRALFGVVGLLIVLVVVGMVARNQLKAVAPTAAPAVAGSAQQPAGDVREQSQQLQQRVTDDVNKALQQAAERNQAADK